MADDLRMALEELVSKAQLNQDEDILRDGVRVLSQALMELEVSHRLGAERYQRTTGRKGQRNGYRERTWDTSRLRKKGVSVKLPCKLSPELDDIRPKRVLKSRPLPFSW